MHLAMFFSQKIIDMIKIFAIFLSFLAVVSNIAFAAKVDIIIGADDEYEIHLGNKHFKSEKASDGDSFRQNIRTLTFNMPAGVFPLTIKAANSKGGNRAMVATIKINDQIYASTDGSGRWRATSEPTEKKFEPQFVPCDKGLYPDFFPLFQKAGGDSNANFLWPDGCSNTDKTEAYFMIDIVVPGQSPTSRKVDFVLGIDNKMEMAQIGPLAISKPDFLPWQVLVKFSVFLEPGSFPFYIKAVNTDGDYRGFAASVGLDGQVLLNTDGSGSWRSSRFFRFYEDKMTPITQVCEKRNEHDQMIASIQESMEGSQPQVIWPNGCKNDGMPNGFFLAKLTVPPQDPSTCKNVEFAFSADNQFSLLHNGRRVFRSLRRRTFPMSWRFLSNFTMCLKPGSNQMTFFAYDFGGLRGLVGGITSEGQTLAITSANGNWSAGIDVNNLTPITQTCEDLWKAGLPERVTKTLPGLQGQPQWIWPGGCVHDPNQKHAYFDVIIQVPGVPPPPSPPSPSNNGTGGAATASAFAMASASAEASAAAVADASATASGKTIDANAEAQASTATEANAEASAKAETKATGDDYGAMSVEAGAKASANAWASVDARAIASASAESAASAPFIVDPPLNFTVDASAQASAKAHASGNDRDPKSATAGSTASASAAAEASASSKSTHAKCNNESNSAQASANASAEAKSTTSSKISTKVDASAIAKAIASAKAEAGSKLIGGKNVVCMCQEIN